MMARSAHSRVGVIGGGIAGLVTAKILRQDGFDVTVFEKEPTIGGVWAASRTYPGLRANNPRETYAFSDFPYPAAADDFPTAEQIRRYLESYADHFGLRPHLRLSTEVISVRRGADAHRAKPRFPVIVRSTSGPGTPVTHHFDFVVVCNGVFSTPHLPALDGRERFAGSVLHSSQFPDSQFLPGKRVVVVGAGKSALDCASAAAQQNASCTLVVRMPHWMVPRYFFGRIRLDRLLTTRFSEALLPPYHRPTRVETVLHHAGAPLLRLWWRAQTRLIQRLMRMPAMMAPDTPLPFGLENSGVGDEFYRLLRQGRLQVERARLVGFAGPDAVRLDTGKDLRADVVIFATGWRQELAFLDEPLHRLVLRDGQLHLYRHILPPEEPHLGFVGYASSSACQFTSELAAHWLSQCFQGELRLPTVPRMEQEIARVLRWTKANFPARPEGYFIGLYIAHYADDLMREMGLRTRRTSNVLSEYLLPFWPERYRDIAAERQRGRQAAPLDEWRRP